MKKIIILLVAFVHIICADVAPIFQEVHHFFDGDLTSRHDEINYLFNGRQTAFPKDYGVTIAHQNREWDYNWFILSLVAPTKYGAFGFGYSNYGSTAIPVTASDNIGPYIDSYSSDTFQNIMLSYQPPLTHINAQILINYKHRQLVTESASAFGVDVQLSSNQVLDNKVGLRTRNLLMSKYTWSDDTTETLAKYVGVCATVPFKFKDSFNGRHHFNFFLEYDYSLNYEDINITTGTISYRFHESISLFATYRIGTYMNVLSFGSYLKLTERFSMGYSNQTESNDHYDLAIHAISIGVNF